MKKEVLYLWIIAVLTLVNALQLGVFLLKPDYPRPPLPHQRHSFRAEAVELLGLSKSQKEQFSLLAKDHRNKMEVLNRMEMETTKRYFEHPSDSSLVRIQRIQPQKIELTKKHFDEIKKILNRNQIPLFENFKNSVLKRIFR